jgi:hypothetical protein
LGKQEVVVASVFGYLVGDQLPSPAEILNRAKAALQARDHDQPGRPAHEIADNPDLTVLPSAQV